MDNTLPDISEKTMKEAIEEFVAESSSVHNLTALRDDQLNGVLEVINAKDIIDSFGCVCMVSRYGYSSLSVYLEVE